MAYHDFVSVLHINISKVDLKRSAGGFCNHFAELEIVLYKVELSINNAPLKIVYPNTKETCLSPNHLLFGRQLLYPSNTTLTVATNLTVLSNSIDKINHISNHFCDRWRHEYVVTLR